MSSKKYDDFSKFSLSSLIRTLRSDLCELFPLEDEDDFLTWISWLAINGREEYKSIAEDALLSSFLTLKDEKYGISILQRVIYEARSDIQDAFALPEKKVEYLQWFYTHGVEEHKLWYWLSDAQKDAVMSQDDPWPRRIQAAAKKVAPKKTYTPFEKREFGVNLVGYVFGQLGIGEDVRMAARAMLAVDVPFTMIDFPPGDDIPQNDRSMEKYASEDGEFAFNIFCMTALENGRFFAERGKGQLEGRYNIGYWPWELSKWPKEWKQVIDIVDEIWVSTKHTYDSVAPVANVPVYVMPMAVELGEISKKNRRDFGLPKSAKLFCFSFDLNSSIHRKNPQACVDAFLKAFPVEDKADVGLVIKVHPPKEKHKIWEKLKNLALSDSRIHIIEKTLSRSDLLALYASCDCFLSLHRAEGFGRGIAEALQLGLHVITTGYSGNIDFCHAPYVDLVKYKLVKVKNGQYPFSDGQEWADADVNHAAKLMQEFVNTPKNKKKTKSEWSEFSTKTVGQKYKERLLNL